MSSEEKLIACGHITSVIIVLKKKKKKQPLHFTGVETKAEFAQLITYLGKVSTMARIGAS